MQNDLKYVVKELAKRHDHPIYLSVDSLFANTFWDYPYGHPVIGIEWPIDEPMLSDKDRQCSQLKDIPPDKLPVMGARQ